MKQAIKDRARELGFDDCRITTAAPPDHAEKLQRWLDAGQHGEMAWIARNAHKRVEPQHVLVNARSVITLAVAYSGDRGGAVPQPAESTGEIARYARFADYHDVLGERLKTLTEFVNARGGPETRSLWYVDTGPLLERDLAERAGLGFVGKHTNLISRSLGNWIFLSEIITTLEIEPDEPEKNYCGSCTRCLSACPTGAITEPFNVDARLCISYLTIELKGAIPLELRPKIGNRIYGCDDCLAVCPWNKFARIGAMMQPLIRHDLDTPDLIELLSLNDAAFKAKFAGTPILRTKRRGLLRNVCVALGNMGDVRAIPALEKALHDSEPLIREHAQWALDQIRGVKQVELAQPARS
ncbi:MAG TPA: tRNA epoxyqueuosine(34) reductase QueG [Candidatus Acidoferrum sp.]|nr:tRNA epoxyqueuosine(34) reductase QueG [Candidatus Acidoferrum sp.]